MAEYNSAWADLILDCNRANFVVEATSGKPKKWYSNQLVGSPSLFTTSFVEKISLTPSIISEYVPPLPVCKPAVNCWDSSSLAVSSLLICT